MEAAAEGAGAYNLFEERRLVTDYSRQYRSRPGALQWMFPPFTGAVRALILACAGVFALQLLLGMMHPTSEGLASGLDPAERFIRIFGLVPIEVLHGKV